MICLMAEGRRNPGVLLAGRGLTRGSSFEQIINRALRDNSRFSFLDIIGSNIIENQEFQGCIQSLRSFYYFSRK